MPKEKEVPVKFKSAFEAKLASRKLEPTEPEKQKYVTLDRSEYERPPSSKRSRSRNQTLWNNAETSEEFSKSDGGMKKDKHNSTLKREHDEKNKCSASPLYKPGSESKRDHKRPHRSNNFFNQNSDTEKGPYSEVNDTITSIDSTETYLNETSVATSSKKTKKKHGETLLNEHIPAVKMHVNER